MLIQPVSRNSPVFVTRVMRYRYRLFSGSARWKVQVCGLLMVSGSNAMEPRLNMPLSLVLVLEIDEQIRDVARDRRTQLPGPGRQDRADPRRPTGPGASASRACRRERLTAPRNVNCTSRRPVTLLVDAKARREARRAILQHAILVMLEAAVVGAVPHDRLHRRPAIERETRASRPPRAGWPRRDREGLTTSAVPLWVSHPGPEFTFVSRSRDSAVLEYHLVPVAEAIAAGAIHPVTADDLRVGLVEKHAHVAGLARVVVVVLDVHRHARDAVGLPRRSGHDLERQHLPDVVAAVDDGDQLVLASHPIS